MMTSRLRPRRPVPLLATAEIPALRRLFKTVKNLEKFVHFVIGQIGHQMTLAFLHQGQDARIDGAAFLRQAQDALTVIGRIHAAVEIPALDQRFDRAADLGLVDLSITYHLRHRAFAQIGHDENDPPFGLPDITMGTQNMLCLAVDLSLQSGQPEREKCT